MIISVLTVTPVPYVLPATPGRQFPLQTFCINFSIFTSVQRYSHCICLVLFCILFSSQAFTNVRKTLECHLTSPLVILKLLIPLQVIFFFYGKEYLLYFIFLTLDTSTHSPPGIFTLMNPVCLLLYLVSQILINLHKSHTFQCLHTSSHDPVNLPQSSVISLSLQRLFLVI